MATPASPEYLPEFATQVSEILGSNETVDKKKEALKTVIGNVATGLESFRQRVELANQIAQSPNASIDFAKRQQFVMALNQAESEAMSGFTPEGVGGSIDKLLYQALPRSMPTQWKFGTAIGGAAAAIGLPLLWEKLIKPATRATGRGVAAVAEGTWGGVTGVTGWLWTKFKQVFGLVGIGTVVAGAGHFLGFWKFGSGNAPQSASLTPPPSAATVASSAPSSPESKEYVAATPPQKPLQEGEAPQERIAA